MKHLDVSPKGFVFLCVLFASAGCGLIIYGPALPTSGYSLHIVTNQAASIVLGQPNMASNTSNNGGITASSLSNPTYLSYWEPVGKHLLVTDYGNNRVMIWNGMPTSNFQPANIILGQPNTTTGTPNTGTISLATMNSPNGVFATATQVFVSDTFNHRMLVWNSFPTFTGQPADFVLGQPTPTSNGAGCGPNLYNHPDGVFSDGQRLYQPDFFNQRILVYDHVPTAPVNPDYALGQPDTSTCSLYGTSANTFSWPGYVFFDGTNFLAADCANYRFLLWKGIPSVGQNAKVVLGQPNFTTAVVNNGGTSASSVNYPPAYVFSTGIQVFAADPGNNRVLVWNSIPTSNFQAADLVLGQSNFTSSGAGVSATALSYPTGLISDGTNLVVNDGLNARVLIYTPAY